MIETLEDMINKFNTKLDESEKLYEKLKDKTRTIQLELDESVFYQLKMIEGRIEEIIPEAVKEPETPDLRVITSSETFQGIIEKTVKPFKAYVLKKIKIKGKLMDRLLIKDLLSATKKDKKE